MAKISLLDKKLMFLLDTNARLTNTQLAKRLRVSKQTIAYRLNKLEQQGIIVNYITLSHFAKTDLIQFKIYIQLRQTTNQEAHEIIAFLETISSIGWLASTQGKFDLMFSIRYKTIYEFEEFLDNFSMRFAKHFATMQLAILTEAETKPREYLTDQKANKTFLHCDKAAPVALDEEDKLLLSAIATNARAPAHVLAQETNLTPRIIRYRTKQLEQQGVIVGYKLAIDYRKLGYLFFKCFVSFQSLNEETYKRFRHYAREHPNIIYWIKTLGAWDAELEIEVPDIEHFYALLDEIKQLFADIILRIESSLVAVEHKIKHS